MSDRPKLKAPPLNLRSFQADTDGQEREFIAHEESTMITSLDEMERARAAQEYSLKALSSTGKLNSSQTIPTPKLNLSQTIPHAAYNSSSEDFSTSDSSLAYNIPSMQNNASKDTADHVINEVLPQDIKANQYDHESTEHFESFDQYQSVIESSTPTSDHLSDVNFDSTLANQLLVQEPQLLAFFNARGGVGATTTAIHVAHQLSEYQSQVALVDMDLQMCSIPSCLELKLERSLAEFVHESHQTQSGPITSGIDYHSSGVAVIAQDGRIHEIKEIIPTRLPRFYEALSHTHPMIVVDGIRSFSDHAVSVMDLATRIVLMITQDVPAVRSARKALQLFDRLGYSSAKVCVVVNRFHKRSPISLDLIETSLNREVDFTLSNDFPFISQVISEGTLASELNPKHKMNHEFKSLALNLIGRHDLVPQPKSWWSKLLNRSRS